MTIVLAAAAAAVSFAPAALAARVHSFKAAYTGHGAGAVTTASGHASASGSGNVIGRSTLSGAATGIVQSPTCVAFNGKARLKGSGGSIVLRARGAQACISGQAGANVKFSGKATDRRNAQVRRRARDAHVHRRLREADHVRDDLLQGSRHVLTQLAG